MEDGREDGRENGREDGGLEGYEGLLESLVGRYREAAESALSEISSLQDRATQLTGEVETLTQVLGENPNPVANPETHPDVLRIREIQAEIIDIQATMSRLTMEVYTASMQSAVQVRMDEIDQEPQSDAPDGGSGGSGGGGGPSVGDNDNDNDNNIDNNIPVETTISSPRASAAASAAASASESELQRAEEQSPGVERKEPGFGDIVITKRCLIISGVIFATLAVLAMGFALFTVYTRYTSPSLQSSPPQPPTDRIDL